MLVMGISASILAFRKSPTDMNVFGGFMTLYFVGTALTTVRPVSPWTRSFNVVMLAIAPTTSASTGVEQSGRVVQQPMSQIAAEA